MLCAEEYRWHWRSFTTGGGSAIWLLLYGIFYYASRLSLDSFSSVVLYMGYLSVPTAPSRSVTLETATRLTVPLTSFFGPVPFQAFSSPWPTS